MGHFSATVFVIILFYSKKLVTEDMIKALFYYYEV